MSEPSSSLFSDLRLDPFGRLLDALPWPIRRLYLAARLREWPPDEARVIGFCRPPESVFEHFRRLHGLD